jgi:D-alanyl-D-alanine carboxypeptidase
MVLVALVALVATACEKAAVSHGPVLAPYAGTQQIVVAPDIVGDPHTDGLIRSLAVERGYKLTSLPTGPLTVVTTGTIEQGPTISLQADAAAAWLELHDAAEADAIPLRIISGFRSVDDQRRLFVDYLSHSGPIIGTTEQIKAGIDFSLRRVAPPGFSRHHTGFTIDLSCADDSVDFASSTCFRWISQNGYNAARRFGWTPSYAGTTREGPEPEPWEFVWRSIS